MFIMQAVVVMTMVESFNVVSQGKGIPCLDVYKRQTPYIIEQIQKMKFERDKNLGAYI